MKQARMTGGSTTLPRVPPTCQSPANRNKQPHGTMSLGCGRLFRLGLAIQLVSRPAKSFHAVDQSLLVLVVQQEEELEVLFRFQPSAKNGLTDIAGPLSRGLQSTPPALGIDFRTAVSKDFGGVLH